MNKPKPEPRSHLPRYQREARFLQALAHPARLAIVDLLAQGERCGCEIDPYLGLDQSTVSRHLQILRRAGVLKARKDGVRVIYAVRSAAVIRLRDQLAKLIMRQAREELAQLSGGAPGAS